MIKEQVMEKIKGYQRNSTLTVDVYMYLIRQDEADQELIIGLEDDCITLSEEEIIHLYSPEGLAKIKAALSKEEIPQEVSHVCIFENKYCEYAFNLAGTFNCNAESDEVMVCGK